MCVRKRYVPANNLIFGASLVVITDHHAVDCHCWLSKKLYRSCFKNYTTVLTMWTMFLMNEYVHFLPGLSQSEPDYSFLIFFSMKAATWMLSLL